MSHTEGSGASRAADLCNEDVFLAADELGLYVVCDGASSGPHGALAAHIAIEALEAFVQRAEAEHGPVLTRAPISTRFADRAVRQAIGAVVEAAQTKPDLRGMSTTLSMFLALGGRGVIGHVGDSRVYRIRRRALTQLTIDHDHSEALSSSPLGADGPAGQTELIVDTFAVDLAPDDLYVLCSDGAVDALSEPGLVRNAPGASPRMLASRIVSIAHRAHRDVDATAVVVHVREQHGASAFALSGRPALAAFGYALAAGSPRALPEDESDEADEDDLAEAQQSGSLVSRRSRASTGPIDELSKGPGGSRTRTRTS